LHQDKHEIANQLEEKERKLQSEMNDKAQLEKMLSDMQDKLV
jgi:hypothetical protein